MSKRRKNVFTSNELPHVWAHSRQDSGRTPSNQSFRNGTYYSYTTPIGERCVRPDNGEVFYVINGESYSNTTAGHMSNMRSAIPYTAETFYVDGPSRWSYGGLVKFTDKGSGPDSDGNIVWVLDLVETGKKVLERAERGLDNNRKAVPKARSNKPYNQNSVVTSMMQINKIIDYFGLESEHAKFTEEQIQAEFDLVAVYQAEVNRKAEALAARTPDEVHKAREKREAEKRRRETAEQAKYRQEQEVKIQHWLAGDYNYFPESYKLPVFLRINGDMVQTSRGASVKVSTARRLWPFIIQRRMNGWKKNGESFSVDGFSLDSVNQHEIVVGCHKIGWDQIENIADQLGIPRPMPSTALAIIPKPWPMPSVTA